MICSICGRDSAPDYHPFCSRRCADVDLAHWLRGSYAIPTDEPADGLPDAGTGQPGSEHPAYRQDRDDPIRH